MTSPKSQEEAKVLKVEVGIEALDLEVKAPIDGEDLSHGGKARTDQRDSAGSARSGSRELKKAESPNRFEDGDGELEEVIESEKKKRRV